MKRSDRRSLWKVVNFAQIKIHERNARAKRRSKSSPLLAKRRLPAFVSADAGFPLCLSADAAFGFGSGMTWEPAVINIVGVVAFNTLLEMLNVQSLACTIVSSGATWVAGAECNGASGHGIGGRGGAIQASRSS
jgi:hypothetical protein